MQLGLIFRVRGAGSAAFLATGDATARLATIQQRNDPRSPNLSGTPTDVCVFNRDQFAFDQNPPRLERLMAIAHAGTVGLAWKLAWSSAPRSRIEDPEHHLNHYNVVRRCLDGSERERQFTVKVPDVLNKSNGKLKRCRSRFQFVDHFGNDTDVDLANLPPQGRRYAYTITPIDTSGRHGVSYTELVTRRPSTPPPAISKSELIIQHRIALNTEFAAPASPVPRVRHPDRISYVWEAPADPPTGPKVAIAGFRLVFRRDSIFPVGAYGADTEAAGPRSRGLPTSNARPLRTDFYIERDYASIAPGIDDSTGVRRYVVDLELTELAGIMPDDLWLPESWLVFVQSRSSSGVYSALVPVVITLRFRDQTLAATGIARLPDDDEERRFGTLEWLPKPVALPLLPPRDTGGSAGFALVPMPPADVAGNNIGKFQRHPRKRRGIRLAWNPAPSHRVADVSRLPAAYPSSCIRASTSFNLMRMRTSRTISMWKHRAALMWRPGRQNPVAQGDGCRALKRI